MQRRKKAKVLMVTPYLPFPPLSGGQTRSFNLIKNISDKVDITLISFALPDQDKKKATEIEKYVNKQIIIDRGRTWNLNKLLFTAFTYYPLLVSNYYSQSFKNLIKNELADNEYDLIHVECFYLMPNIPKTNIPVLLVDQTIEFAVYKHFVENLKGIKNILKPILWLDVLKIKFWEKKFWKQADTLVAVSRDDQKLMKTLSQREVGLVLNGVSDDFFKDLKVKKYKKPTVLFGIANFKWMQNKEGAENLIKFIWPKIKKQLPNAQLIIAGRHSENFLTSSFPALDTKDITCGQVDNPQKIYQKSWVLVAPMASGGGSRTKFFEAMASKLPILTTPIGIEGIEAKHNENVLLADSFDKLAKLTVKALKNKKLREKIGNNSKKLVIKNYDWRSSAKQLLDIYQNTMRKYE
jgi:glycosyltransferase involved in cell wall biosynthesis